MSYQTLHITFFFLKKIQKKIQKPLLSRNAGK